MRVLKDNTSIIFTTLLQTKAQKDNYLMFMCILMTKEDYNSYQDYIPTRYMVEIFYHSNKNSIILTTDFYNRQIYKNLP